MQPNTIPCKYPPVPSLCHKRHLCPANQRGRNSHLTIAVTHAAVTGAAARRGQPMCRLCTAVTAACVAAMVK